MSGTGLVASAFPTARAARVGRPRIGRDLTEPDPLRLRQHPLLEGAELREVHGHAEERAPAAQELAQLRVRALGVGSAAHPAAFARTPQGHERHPLRRGLDVQPVGEIDETSRGLLQAPVQPSREPRGCLGTKVRSQCLVDRVHGASSCVSCRFRMPLPRASWLLTVLTEMPRILASSWYESPST